MINCISCGSIGDGVLPFLKPCEKDDILPWSKQASSNTLESRRRNIECEITRVEGLVEQLQQELSQLKSHKNELSPISRLPVEVLSEIFVYATPYSVNPTNNMQPELLSPLFLGAVCKKWREIAWTTPNVWTSISIFISKEERYPIQTELLRGWLKRARGLPLTIKLTWDDAAFQIHNWGVRVKQCKEPTSIIELLLTYSKQWLSVDFYLEYDWFHHFMNSDFQFQFPLLEAIALRCSDRVELPNTSRPWDQLNIFAGCSVLHKLHIERFQSNLLGYVPWSSIQSLVVAHNSAEDTGRILSEVKNVREVHLSNIFQSSWVGISLDQEVDISLPEVVSFSIESLPMDLSHLMDRLSLPKVEEIRISIPSKPDTDDEVDDRFDRLNFSYYFKRWSKKWPSNLTSLKIEGALRGTSQDLLQGLSEITSLEKVEIDNRYGEPLELSRLSDSFIEGAQANDCQNLSLETTPFRAFLPNLRRFKYIGPVSLPSPPLVPKLVQALLLRRKTSLPLSLSRVVQASDMVHDVRQLDEFIMEVPHHSASLDIDESFKDELCRLVDDGMYIDVVIGGIPLINYKDTTLADRNRSL